MTAGSRWRTVLERWTAPVAPVRSSRTALGAYPWFVRSWRAYARLPGAERLRIRDGYPCLLDRVAETPYDPHYFHQAVWAIERIIAEPPEEHVDVGSETGFVGMLSAIVPVSFVDIRPLRVELPRLRSVVGDVLALPFPSQSVVSLSCLHVAEHVGLGRYGDELAPAGTRLACTELQRILAVGGTLLFSVPVGRPRVHSNAHRIHAPNEIVAYFDELELIEFAVVDDQYRLVNDADLDQAGDLTYGCGMFRFTRHVPAAVS